jgi:hypothetical protein
MAAREKTPRLGKAPSVLADLIHPVAAYARSTNIELARKDPSGVADYKFTSKSLRLLEEVIDSITGSRRDRAWSIIGPYGSGKSTFSLFLLQLLSGAESPWLERCLLQLQISDPALERRVRAELTNPKNQYVPVVVNGARVPLDLALCRALARVVSPKGPGGSWTPKSFRSSVDLTLQTIEAGVSDSSKVIELFQQASSLAQIAGYQGILVIIDEFGKFLERAAWQGDLPDLITAQYLAEFASSGNEPQLLLAVLLHQGFQHYGSSLSQRQWIEWAKIQGRFRQVDFNEAPENMYDLIAATLSGAKTSEAGRKIQVWASRTWDQTKNLKVFEDEAQSKVLSESLPKVYPLHPLTLYALPRLSARLGQNERTLFTFLASDEPLGLKTFLRTVQDANGELPSLTIDYLFDYFLSGARFGSLPPDVQHRVSEIDAALDRLGDRPATEVRMIKVLGALSTLRLGPTLRATQEVLIAALAADTDADKSEVMESLERLLARKILVYRQFSGEYRVWQGSDFDFDAALAKARDEIQSDFDLATVLTQEVPPVPLTARRHSFETGTTRIFETQFFSADQVLANGLETLTTPRGTSVADGLVVYIVPIDQRQLRDVKNFIESISEPRLLVVIPKEPLGIEASAADLASLRRIYNTWPELRDDPVALKELASRIEAAEESLRDSVEWLTEPSIGGADYYWKGINQDVKSRRDLNVVLSSICDEVYSRAPVMRNELINRRRLSTSVVFAVKKIIAGLVQDQRVPSLGFQGNGPEVSIFRAVFEDKGLYTPEARDCLRKPSAKMDPKFAHVWDEIETFFTSTTDTAKTFEEIYQTLTRPPYGLREGLVHLIVWAALIYHRGTAVVYHSGTYVKDWNTELFDHFVRFPERFTLHWLVMAGVNARLVTRLNACTPGQEKVAVDEDEAVPMKSFLENLYQWYSSLPEYSKRTLRVSSEAAELRHVLTTAVDPIELLLQKMPKALGVPPLGPEKMRHVPLRFVKKFGEVTSELQGAYPALINEIIGSVVKAFNLNPGISEMRTFFGKVPRDIIGHIRDTTLKAFFLRAKDKEQSDLVWIESICAALAGQPPRFWMDTHNEDFLDLVAMAGLALSDAERRAYARRKFSNQSGKTMTRVTIEDSSGFISEEIIDPSIDVPSMKTGMAILDHLDISMPDLSHRDKQLALVQAITEMARYAKTTKDLDE